MGFFYDSISISALITFIAFIIVYVGYNWLANRSLKWGIFSFVILPIIMAVTIWINTVPGSQVDTWFSKAKIFSCTAGVLIFMALRYSKKIQSIKLYYCLPAIILALNIWEAVSREWEIRNWAPGIHDNMFYMGGTWNELNALAGLINLLTITGWVGIRISTNKSKDMVWPDMTWWWVLAYDAWNFTYAYNALTDRSFYVLPVLLAANIYVWIFKEGSWLQQRAQTLAISNYILFTIPTMFVTGFTFMNWLPGDTVVNGAHEAAPMWTLSIISLIINLAVLAYEVYVVIKFKKNPLKGEELYTHTKYHKKVTLAENNLVVLENEVTNNSKAKTNT